jgi:DNA-binding GntR family transcriptional regulator
MLKEQAYQHICRKIERGELLPGDQVSARAMAKEVGASFIPVREAIVQLTCDGWIDHRSGVGTFVAHRNRQDLADMYQLRELLEGFAAEQATGGLRVETTRSMAEAALTMRRVLSELQSRGSDEWTPEQVELWNTCDRRFHLELLGSAGNRAIVEAAERLMSLGRMLAWTWRSWKIDALAQTCEEHDQIVSVLRRRDGQAARELVVAHIRIGCETTIQGFEAQRLQWKPSSA